MLLPHSHQEAQHALVDALAAKNKLMQDNAEFAKNLEDAEHQVCLKNAGNTSSLQTFGIATHFDCIFRPDRPPRKIFKLI